MKINWKVRIKNKIFWLTVIPSILLVIQVIGSILGFDFAVDVVGEKAALLVNSVFSLLFILGLVNDPTTEGLEDSKQSLDYEEPKKS